MYNNVIGMCVHLYMFTDPVYMNAFLLTYRSFTTPQELLQLLKLRYNVPLPTRATSSELEQFIKAHQNPIRLRF